MAEGTEAGQGALSAADLTGQYKTLEARFDQAAKTYDACFGEPSGSRPGNALLCWLRAEHLDVVRSLVPPGAALPEFPTEVPLTHSPSKTLPAESTSVSGRCSVTRSFCTAWVKRTVSRREFASNETLSMG